MKPRLIDRCCINLPFCFFFPSHLADSSSSSDEHKPRLRTRTRQAHSSPARVSRQNKRKPIRSILLPQATPSQYEESTEWCKSEMSASFWLFSQASCDVHRRTGGGTEGRRRCSPVRAGSRGSCSSCACRMVASSIAVRRASRAAMDRSGSE